MSGVFGEFVPPAFGAGEDTLAGWRGGRGSIVRKTPDTGLYSIYVSTLCSRPSRQPSPNTACVENLFFFTSAIY
jgi:hypothetical protein